MARRLKIPEPTKLKLWVAAGGRCQFPSCNKVVWRDGLTLKEDNFAHVAHIVGASKDGPRGDELLSEKEQANYDNLMLLCFDHHKLVDGKHEEEYSEDQLREYKRKHEERIMRQTALGPESATTVVRFQSPIRDRKAAVARSDAYAALYPRFPADDKGVFLDYSMKAGSGDESHWASFAQEVSDEVRNAFRIGNDGHRHEHLSIFAMAPIPILMHLGNRIGNVIPIDFYQKHRDSDDWKWKDEIEPDDFRYRYSRSDGDSSEGVGLVLSLSGKIAREEYEHIARGMPVYEIEVEDPNPAFLKFRSRLQKFKSAYRQALTDIRAAHGRDCLIHLFPAIPAPIAVLCGAELLPKSDPAVRVYDNDKARGGFVPTLTIR